MFFNSKRSAAVVLTTGLVLTATLVGPAAAAPLDSFTVAPGETRVLTETTEVDNLIIGAGGQLTAPDGYTITMTADGVELGSVLVGEDRIKTVIPEGQYPNVVLTVAKANEVTIDPLTFPLRQAVHISGGAVQAASSVTAAVREGQITDISAEDLVIMSQGEAFNGVYISDGEYTLLNPDITLIGNGRSDFAGYGAGLVTDGGSQVRVEGAKIEGLGVVRTPVVATGGSTLVVTDSVLACRDGVLPDSYVPTVNLAWMQSVPWMLGASGNCRTTNLLGTDTRASYLNSTITATGWGAMSTDTGSNMSLLVVNSTVDGGSGYGSYAIGNATEHFLGVDLTAEAYAAINRGGLVHYGDASPEAVSAINSARGMGLTTTDISAVTQASTTVESERFGVMWHGGGSVVIDGATQFTTGEAVFLNKGQAINVMVDGSQGASITSGNGVIMQLMEDDDPGPVPPDMTNTGTYIEPTGPITPAGYDIYHLNSSTTTDSYGNTVLSGDAVSTFTDITLVGDFYNAIRGNNPPTMFGPGTAGLNMGVTLVRSNLTGVITSSTATHSVSTITADNYQELGTVTNVPTPAVNNGAIVELTDSLWTLTGTSHLTSLTLDDSSRLLAPDGMQVQMTVDGQQMPITAGSSWTGQIVLELVPAPQQPVEPSAGPDPRPKALPATGIAR